jgi:hypothetical protein
MRLTRAREHSLGVPHWAAPPGRRCFRGSSSSPDGCPLVRLKDAGNIVSLPMHMQRRRSVSFGHAARAITLVVGAALSAGFATADTTDWTLGAGGLYTSSGGTGRVLVGSNIPTLTVTGDGTPVDNGDTLPIIDGLLDFTSGAYNGNGSNWSWGAGGVLNLTGCITGVTAAVCNGSDNVDLISDDFQSVQIESILGNLDVVFGNITGVLNAQVAAYFGVSTTFQVASFDTAIATTGQPGSALSGTNILGVIQADPPASTSMPEQWGIAESLLFFGATFLSFAALLRFRILRPALGR